MSRLEELQKAADDALEELKKANAAWDAWDDNAYAAADAVYGAFCDTHDAYLKAMKELKAYKKEHGL